MDDPNEMTELFARDPLNYSQQDIAKIVERTRQHFTQHELGPKPKKEAPKKSSKTLDLLKDLGLG